LRLFVSSSSSSSVGSIVIHFVQWNKVPKFYNNFVVVVVVAAAAAAVYGRWVGTY
jgi:hypothetical protein